MSYRYKVGDAVKVRCGLEYGACYYMHSGPNRDEAHNTITPEMKKYEGKIVHIKYTGYGQYQVKEVTGRFWTDEMFEDTEESECFCESLL
mgnify:CR=1 FL=1